MTGQPGSNRDQWCVFLGLNTQNTHRPLRKVVAFGLTFSVSCEKVSNKQQVLLEGKEKVEVRQMYREKVNGMRGVRLGHR